MSDTQNNKKIKVFLDNVGRTILGEYKSETDETLDLINPVVLSTQATPDNRMAIQLFPLFFREFLAEKDADVTFSFPKKTITTSDIETIDFRLQAQYSQIFNKSNLYVPSNSVQQPSNNPSVVKLFDE
jgi:hypothetical protein